MMNKEDYERERVRWQQKLEEAERRLAEAEVFNSGMNQIKAELNKKIIEMERNQRPLIEQNRRLNERTKTLLNEIKKSEQKLSHSQDDFLTLKDAYEKLTKENHNLKEQRAFPEKLEELERYRNQVLEYSKCITALKQAGLEKDRRHELLMQKLKKFKKSNAVRKIGENDDDIQSSFGGSDCSASTISLDIAAEDTREMNGNSYLDDTLKEQLLCAQATIAQQQRIIKQQAAQEIIKETVDRCTETERWISEEDIELMMPLSSDLDFDEICEIKEEINDLKRSAYLNDNERSAIGKFQLYLEIIEKQMLELELNCDAQIDEYKVQAEVLEKQIKELEEILENEKIKQTKVEQTQAKLHEYSAVCINLQKQNGILREEVHLMKKKMQEFSKQMNECSNHDKSIIEELNSKMKARIKKNIMECDELMLKSKLLNEALESAKNDLINTRSVLEKTLREKDDLCVKLEEAVKKISELEEEVRPAIRSQLERRYEESKYRLKCALETQHENEEEISKLNSKVSQLENELTAERVPNKSLENLQEYTKELEEQFASQSRIIEVLKEKAVKNKLLLDFFTELHDPKAETLTKAEINSEIQKFMDSQLDDFNRRLCEVLQGILKLVI